MFYNKLSAAKWGGPNWQPDIGQFVEIKGNNPLKGQQGKVLKKGRMGRFVVKLSDGCTLEIFSRELKLAPLPPSSD